MAVQGIRVCRDVSCSRAVLACHQIRCSQILKKATACGLLNRYEWNREDAAVWAAFHPAIDPAGLAEAALTVFRLVNRFLPEVFSELALVALQIWIWPLNPSSWRTGLPAKVRHFVWVANHQICVSTHRPTLGLKDAAVWRTACMEKAPIGPEVAGFVVDHCSSRRNKENPITKFLGARKQRICPLHQPGRHAKGSTLGLHSDCIHGPRSTLATSRANQNLDPSSSSLQIWVLMGYPVPIQHLVSGRHSLQDNRSMTEYGIKADSTISLNFRLRGGAVQQGRSSSAGGEKGKKAIPQQQPPGGLSYKNILQGTKSAGPPPVQEGAVPRPYIVEQLGQTPIYKIVSSGTEDYVKTYETQALICRFNCFWPKPMDLFHWIFTQWTMECDIHLCSKGFFIVKFNSTEIRDLVLTSGPWFWGSTGLFLTPWFPDFDPNTMTVARMPVWVRLHNLPLNFWSDQVLAGIGNSIGKYIKTDTERLENRIYTFARICVEVDLSKGLTENIMLSYKQQNWLQGLDYENTAFRCKICRQPGHLQSSCPDAKKGNNKKKQKEKQRKGWHFPPSVSEDEESEAEEDPIPTGNNETTQGQEGQRKETSDQKVPQHHQNHTERTNEDTSAGGVKRHHSSDTSDSDKDTGPQISENQLVLVTTAPPESGWRKVEKKKGRKT